MRSFYENCVVERVLSSVAAGQAASNSSIVDTLGYDSVTFIAAIGVVDSTGTVTLVVQQGDEPAGGDMAALSSATASADSDDDEKLLCVEIYRPTKRYLRCVVTTAVGDAEIDGVFCIKRDPARMPVTQSDDVVEFVLLASPLEA